MAQFTTLMATLQFFLEVFGEASDFLLQCPLVVSGIFSIVLCFPQVLQIGEECSCRLRGGALDALALVCAIDNVPERGSQLLDSSSGARMAEMRVEDWRWRAVLMWTRSGQTSVSRNVEIYRYQSLLRFLGLAVHNAFHILLCIGW